VSNFGKYFINSDTELKYEATIADLGILCWRQARGPTVQDIKHLQYQSIKLVSYRETGRSLDKLLATFHVAKRNCAGGECSAYFAPNNQKYKTCQSTTSKL
jgi:hypothetical protein